MSTVQITADTTSPALAGLHATLAPGNRRRLMAVLGKTAEVELRRWFRQRNLEPNRRGWPKQQFWARIRTRTAYDPAQTTDSSAAVVISDPAFAAKVHGATIVPKNARNLAIPLRPEAYGIRPSSGLIPGLFLLVTARGAFLAARRANALRLFYVLKRRVTVSADPKALPPAAALNRTLTTRAQSFLTEGGKFSA